ncbi:glutamate--cysteine ligase catalytic subunit-like [Ornithodoros turicata]|uniref:glutamate--cysteine ligase catalytic subunit-like n=1 Tax=Ornithodoros turicata TaxID=34597 RepID=UPI00313964E1
MGLLSEGSPLSWEETKRLCEHVRHHGILQFIIQYHSSKNRKHDCLRWGDEIEYMLVRFDHENRRAQLCLRAAQLLSTLNERDGRDRSLCSWHPEFAVCAIEAIPNAPYGDLVSHYNVVEHNMRERRAEVRALLAKDEEIICITTFPTLGCPQYTFPVYTPSLKAAHMPSLFLPEEMVFPAHPRFKTLARNIRERRGKRVVINVPIYKDDNTRWPFTEDWRALGDDGEAERSARPGHVYMDAMGFGMGNCCLQVTFQACDLTEAKDLYDQLANICPLMLALSASSPAFRGYLVDTDCRFDVITQSVDDRTDEEMGLKPLGPDAHLIKRPRYASIPWYLSSKGQHFNDVPMACDAKVYQALRSANVEEPLARHLSHVFIRDTLCLFSEKLKQHDNIDFDHFENLQSTSWHSLRFKPPPPKSSIGWRVEFRPTELQMTEFENAAYVVFVVLLTRVILTFDLDLIVPISKVDENMKIAQKRDAVLTEKFWFRKDILTHGCPSSVGGVPDESALEIAHMKTRKT